jgi:cyclopropane fatty-acyl-phospholipid synthase-like methyltransferase
VWGIDFTPTAIQKAREKAAQRHLTATFLELNVLELHTLGRTFDSVIDSGLFHTLSDEERPLFVDNLAAVICRGGTYFMLSFSELTAKLDYSDLKDFFPDIGKSKQEDYGGLMDRWADRQRRGPRRVTQAEIKALFRDGWRINYIRQATMEGRIKPGAVQGWLSSISKE